LDLVATTNIRDIMLEHTGATPGQHAITDMNFIDLVLKHRPIWHLHLWKTPLFLYLVLYDYYQQERYNYLLNPVSRHPT
jgi:hypothetical protein